MKPRTLKVFIPALIISAMLAVPQNMIGCGPMMDPYDYFTSFFSKSAVEAKGSRPFFYTSLLDFYDDWNFDDSASFVNDAVVDEWQQFAGEGVKRNDVAYLVYESTAAEMRQLISSVKTPNTSLPPKLKNNSMVQALVKNNQLEAMQYLLLAKSIEPFCTTPDQWSAAPPRDSSKINTYIKQANDAWAKTQDRFFKNKYSYLRVKLAFYNNRLKDCTRWYDESFDANNNAAVKTLALSYKAGAQFRLGKGKEAAYAFSKVFFQSTDKRKKQEFLGFLWATDHCNPKLIDEYSGIAKEKKESAYLTAMFGLYGVDYHLQVIEKVYALDPQCDLLPLLALREVNKVEEKYLTPKLDKQPGSKTFYYSWEEEDTTLISDAHVSNCIAAFTEMASNEQLAGRGLFATCAAYLNYVKGDYANADKSLAMAKQLPATASLKDQQQLIELLLKASDIERMDPTAENNILASVQWLQQKAKTQLEYGIFYRNLFAQVIAPAYYKQGDIFKTALAYGIADKAVMPDSSGYVYYGETGNAIEYLHNNMNTQQVIQLYEYLNNKPATAFDAFLIGNNAIGKDNVVDMLGTNYLRDFDFAKAIEWLQKANSPGKLVWEQYNYKSYKTTVVNINPLHDYINDWQRFGNPANKAFTKLSFAQKMLELEKSLDTAQSNEAKAQLYYQLASGYYNMSYYGNSWMIVAYYRPSSTWNSGKYNVDWEKEYFGVYKAKAYYSKAYELSSNKEFKAAAFFLVAKCAQRQIARPDYDWDQYENWEANIRKFQAKFHNNPLFPQFRKEFGTTKFYQYALSRCSYLRDFAKRK